MAKLQVFSAIAAGVLLMNLRGLAAAQTTEEEVTMESTTLPDVADFTTDSYTDFITDFNTSSTTNAYTTAAVTDSHTTTASGGDGAGLSGGAIAGIAVGGFVAVCLVVGLIGGCVCCMGKNKQKVGDLEMETSKPDTEGKKSDPKQTGGDKDSDKVDLVEVA